MPHYEAYGLTLASALPFPELLAGEGRVDVNIDVDRTVCTASQDPSTIRCADISPSRVDLTWGGVGDLRIEGGERMTVVPVRDAEEDAL
jgi:hypothetical protein